MFYLLITPTSTPCCCSSLPPCLQFGVGYQSTVQWGNTRLRRCLWNRPLNKFTAPLDYSRLAFDTLPQYSGTRRNESRRGSPVLAGIRCHLGPWDTAGGIRKGRQVRAHCPPTKMVPPHDPLKYETNKDPRHKIDSIGGWDGTSYEQCGGDVLIAPE